MRSRWFAPMEQFQPIKCENAFRCISDCCFEVIPFGPFSPFARTAVSSEASKAAISFAVQFVLLKLSDWSSKQKVMQSVFAFQWSETRMQQLPNGRLLLFRVRP
jgi:hypothetical protein